MLENRILRMRGYYIMQIQPVKQLRGEVSVPGDKSISHRSIMFGALAKGTTEITHFLHGADCLSTIGCFRAMGINIEDTPDRILVHGKGLHGLSEPSSFLDVGNSGTTTRLISGILSGQPFATTLSGDASLNSRPMKRIMEPLGMMGADILSQNGNGCAPLLINSLLPAGQNPSLHAIHYHSKVASAQVKSSVLLRQRSSRTFRTFFFFRCGEQRNHHKTDFRYSFRSAVCHHSFRRCFSELPPDEEDHGASWDDGR